MYDERCTMYDCGTLAPRSCFYCTAEGAICQDQVFIFFGQVLGARPILLNMFIIDQVSERADKNGSDEILTIPRFYYIIFSYCGAKMEKEKWIKTIKDIRQRYGASQSVFAEKLNVTKNTVQNWEYGKFQPTKANVRAIIEAFSLKREEYPELFEYSDYEAEKEAEIVAVAKDEQIISAKPREELIAEDVSPVPETAALPKAVGIKKWLPLIKTGAIAAGVWLACWITLSLICVCNSSAPAESEAIASASRVFINARLIILYSAISFVAVIAVAVLVRLAIGWNRNYKNKTVAAVPLGIIFLVAPFIAETSAQNDSEKGRSMSVTASEFFDVDTAPSSYFFTRLDLRVYDMGGLVEAKLTNGFSLFSSTITAAEYLCAFDSENKLQKGIFFSTENLETETLNVGDSLNTQLEIDGAYYWGAVAAFYGESFEAFSVEPYYIEYADSDFSE